jgi:four helix bundle protein
LTAEAPAGGGGFAPSGLHVAVRLEGRRRIESMLRIYSDAIEVIRLLEPVLSQVKARNPNLADQCDRASVSVALNVSEGAGQRGGNRRQRYLTALGEAREVWGASDVIEAKGLAHIGPEIRSRLNKIIGTLVNVTR